MGFSLRRLVTPPSSWDSFKRGTLRPIIREAATAGGFVLGGPAGAAAGRALGGIVGDAAAGENVRRVTTLGSVAGDALTGAAMGTGAKAIGAGYGAAKAAGAARSSLPSAAWQGAKAAGSAVNPFGGGQPAPTEADLLAKAADLNVPASQLVAPAAAPGALGGMRPLQTALLAAQAGGNLYAGLQQGRLSEMQANALADDIERRRRNAEITDPQYEALMRDLLSRVGQRRTIPLGPLAGGQP